MSSGTNTVWMQPQAGAEAAQGHCTACPQCPSAAQHGNVPQAQARTCAEPRLEGDGTALARALAALRSAEDAEGNLVDTRRFSRLRIADGEAELTLTFPRTCTPTRVLAEEAFQALRQALPDTDVYVSFTG